MARVVRRWRDLLHADRQRAPLPADWRCAWDGRDAAAAARWRHCWRWKAPTAFRRDRCCVGARQGGERITLPGRAHSHALKHVLQDLGVPPWLRERLPLLSTREGELLAAGDVVVFGALRCLAARQRRAPALVVAHG